MITKEMELTHTSPQTFEDFNIGYNELSIQKLFTKYEEIGFIYPAKKVLLEPHMEQITQNWEMLLQAGKDLVWILTNRDKKEKCFASVCAWKQANYGMIAQHLVSSGNPFLSLKVLMAAQFIAENHFDADQIRSSQNWFRPNNRYAFRVFASMYGRLGPDRSSLILFQYLKMNLEAIPEEYHSHFRIRKIEKADPELNNWIARQYNSVFVRAEELDQEDICLKKLNSRYQKYGLSRSRYILKIMHPDREEILACVICNRAPLGLNFSFLENRAYFIIPEDCEPSLRKELLETMCAVAKVYYNDIALGSIPIVTDKESSDSLQELGAEWMREYMQSIWLREGFTDWYEHIGDFLKKIEKRYGS